MCGDFRRFVLAGCLIASCAAARGAAPFPGPAGRADALGDPLPAGAVFRLGTLRRAQGGPVLGLAFAAGGKTLFAAGDGTPLRRWEADTGKEVPLFGPGAGASHGLALSADRRLLASADDDGFLRVRDAVTGAEVRRWRLEAGACTCLAFAPDGKTVAWADTVIHLGDVTAGKELRQLKPRQDSFPVRGLARDGLPGGTLALAFAPDGKGLASADPTGVLYWDLQTGKRLRRYVATTNNQPLPVEAVLFAADGKTLIAGCLDGAIRVWERDSIEEVAVLVGHGGQVQALAVSPDGRTLASAGQDGSVRRWRLGTGKALDVLRENGPPTTALAFSADGKALAGGDQQGLLRVWDARTGKERAPVEEPVALAALAFADDGRTVVGVSRQSIARWSAATGKGEGRVALSGGELTAAALAPDGRTLALAREDRRIQVLDVATGRAMHEFAGHGGPVLLLAFSPDGKLLASVGAEAPHVVRRWDLGRGKERPPLQHPMESVNRLALAFAPDGRTLLAGHPDEKALQRWEVATGKPRQPFRLAVAAVPARLRAARRPNREELAMLLQELDVARFEGSAVLALSPDGKLLAWRPDEQVCLCDLATGRVVRRLEGSHEPGGPLAFSPDGRLLATTAGDHTVRLWEVATGKEVSRLEGHRGPVRRLAFASGGKLLASASQDGTTVVWEVARLLRVERRARPAVLTPRQREALWAELGSEDAARADAAMRNLGATPAPTVQFLTSRLRPAEPVPAGLLTRLLAELDGASAELRTRATRQLEALEDLAEAELRRAAARPASAEVKRRVERLLDRLDGGPSAELLRQLRAVEVLEGVGSPEARKTLAALARGAPDARLTRDAGAALRRLGRRASP